MKILEVLDEWDEDDGRDMENPIPHSIDMNDALFTKWADAVDSIEEKLLTIELKAAGREDRPKGREYGKAIRLVRKKYGQPTTIDPSKVIATETHLEQSHIDAILNNAERMTSGDMPTVYKFEGKLIVGDGNHRIAANYINKSPSQVLLVDLDSLSKKI